MNIYELLKKRNFIILSVISLAVCIPFWSFEYFLTQDGAAHLYSSYIIGELLKGNEFYGKFFELNHFSTPNSSTHFILALLVQIFPPLLLTKLTATFTLFALPVSLTWLRYSTAGNRDLTLTYLYGLAIGFNFFWLLGFYNFLFGIITFIITLGFFYKWKQELNFTRVFTLSVLFIIVFLSHLTSFLILAGSIFVLTLSVKKEKLIKTAISTAAAFVPVFLIILHYLVTKSNEGKQFRPVWKNITDPLAVGQWLRQFSSVDLFIILSRRTFPFVEFSSSLFYIFSPLLWILAATFILGFFTFFRRDFKNIFTREQIPFVFLFVFSIVFTLFAPDHFGDTNGTLLRERVFICVFIFFVPIFKTTDNYYYYKPPVKLILLSVILYQTFAVFEYAYKTNTEAKNFVRVKKYLSEYESVAVIQILAEQDSRFSSNPLAQINNINGIGENILIWDNYEFAHYLFPVIAKTAQKRKIVYKFAVSNVIDPKLEITELSEKISSVNSVIADQTSGIDKIIIYGKNKEIENRLEFTKTAEIIYSDRNLTIYKLSKS